MLGKKILCSKGTKQGVLIWVMKPREVQFDLGLSNEEALTQGNRKRIPDTRKVPQLGKPLLSPHWNTLEGMRKVNAQSPSKPIYCQNLRWDSTTYRAISLGWKYSCFPIRSQVGSHSILLHPLPLRSWNSQFVSARKISNHQVYCMGNINKTTEDGLFPIILICILKVYSSQQANGQD